MSENEPLPIDPNNILPESPEYTSLNYDSLIDRARLRPERVVDCIIVFKTSKTKTVLRIIDDQKYECDPETFRPETYKGKIDHVSMEEFHRRLA